MKKFTFLLFLLFSLYNYSAKAQVYNDECSGAGTLTNNLGFTGSTRTATNSIGNEAPDVWYKYTGDGRNVTISLCIETYYDSYIRVYTTSDCQTFTQLIEANDNCWIPGTEEITFFAENNIEYYVLVEGFGRASGDFTLRTSATDTADIDPLCTSAAPFCANSPQPLLYAGGTDRTQAPRGVNYGCLITTPNPAWFFMNIAAAGTHTIDLISINNVDVDIAIWG